MKGVKTKGHFIIDTVDCPQLAAGCALHKIVAGMAVFLASQSIQHLEIGQRMEKLRGKQTPDIGHG